MYKKSNKNSIFPFPWRVGKASNCFTQETLDPDYEKMDHYRVDFDAEERVLYQLDFMESEYQRPNRLTYHLFSQFLWLKPI